MQDLNITQTHYCRGHCPHRAQHGGMECMLSCPLHHPHILRTDSTTLEFHMEGETHLINAGDVLKDMGLLRDNLMIRLYQLGQEVQEKGRLLPVREEVLTGHAYPDQDGYVRIRLYGKERRVWITTRTWLEDVIRQQRPLCLVRELFEGVMG